MSEVSSFVRRYRNNTRNYLMHRYRDMRNRVNGKPDGGGKRCPWLGMEIVDRETFIDWALNDPGFKKCWNMWHEEGFITRGPTIHRIRRDQGYLLGNMVFVPHHTKVFPYTKKTA